MSPTVRLSEKERKLPLSTIEAKEKVRIDVIVHSQSDKLPSSIFTCSSPLLFHNSISLNFTALLAIGGTRIRYELTTRDVQFQLASCSQTWVVLIYELSERGLAIIPTCRGVPVEFCDFWARGKVLSERKKQEIIDNFYFASLFIIGLAKSTA